VFKRADPITHTPALNARIVRQKKGGCAEDQDVDGSQMFLWCERGHQRGVMICPPTDYQADQVRGGQKSAQDYGTLSRKEHRQLLDVRQLLYGQEGRIDVGVQIERHDGAEFAIAATMNPGTIWGEATAQAGEGAEG